jgi:hypothetical protein
VSALLRWRLQGDGFAYLTLGLIVDLVATGQDWRATPCGHAPASQPVDALETGSALLLR